MRFHSYAVLLVLVLCAGSIQGQVAGRLGDLEVTGVSYATFARPGDVTIRVTFLGPGVGGIYEVSQGTNLEQVIALAGTGWAPPTENRVKMKVQLLRTAGAQRIVVFEAPLEKLLLSPARQQELQDGDVISIESKVSRGFQWRDFAMVLSPILSMVILIERVAG